MTLLASVRSRYDRLRDFLASAGRDERGVSAVEFALIVPVMCTLFLATAETTQGLQADRKVSLTARAVSDLYSQASLITNEDRDMIINDAASRVMSPFKMNLSTVRVTGIQIDAQQRATVAWSDVNGGLTRQACGTPITVPNDLLPAAGQTGFLVLAEVTHRYTPVMGYLIAGTVTLSDRLYTRPRIGVNVSRSPSQGAGCV